MFDPNKNNPVKVSEETLKRGLSQKVIDKINYEAMLLRWTPQQVVQIYPYLMDEEIIIQETPKVEELLAEQYEDQNKFFNNVDDYTLEDEYRHGYA